jgi:hypothetical protein
MDVATSRISTPILTNSVEGQIQKVLTGVSSTIRENKAAGNSLQINAPVAGTFVN